MDSSTGKYLILAGLTIVLIGIIVYFFSDKFHWLGNLPGDIRIKRKGFSFYFPLTTMILISVLINILIRIFRWLN